MNNCRSNPKKRGGLIRSTIWALCIISVGIFPAEISDSMSTQTKSNPTSSTERQQYETGTSSKSGNSVHIPDWVGIAGLLTAIGTMVVNLMKSNRESREIDIKDLREQRDALNAWIKGELDKSREEISALRDTNAQIKVEKEKAEADRDIAVTELRREIERLTTIYNQTQLLVTVMENNPDTITISNFKAIGYR